MKSKEIKKAIYENHPLKKAMKEDIKDELKLDLDADSIRKLFNLK